MSVASLSRRFEDRFGERTVRFVQFCGVGATGVVVDLAVTTSSLDVTHYLLANLAGFLVAVSWNFAGNWWFVFDRPDGSIPAQYLSYVALHSVTFGLRALVLALLVEIAGVPVLVATVIGIAAAAVANYLGTERILQDGLEWFDAVAAVNSLAHLLYHSRARQWFRQVGVYSLLYGAYMRGLAALHRDDVLELEIGEASAEIYTERPPEIISVLHTLEKERAVLETFVGLVDEESVVWDVGANVGVYSVLAADVGERVVGIEPVPSTAERLQENLDLNDGDGFAIGIALSDETGQMDLALERDELGTQTPTLDADLIDDRDSLQVTVSRGDELVEKRLLPSPDILKIDVEGAELKVLDGLADTLADADAVLVETHGDESVVRELLSRNGFTTESYRVGGQTYLIGSADS